MDTLDHLARAFIQRLPAGAVVRVSPARLKDGRYMITYEGVTFGITAAYRDELIASGRAIEDSRPTL